MCERGELLGRRTEGSYETGVQYLYLLRGGAASLLAGSDLGAVSVGRAVAAAQTAAGRDGAALASLLLLPSLCAIQQLSTQGESFAGGSPASVLLMVVFGNTPAFVFIPDRG